MIEESNEPLDHYHFANSLVQKGYFAEAINHYERAIELDSENLDCDVYVFAAWILATAPDRSLRNGSLAIEYALEACEITDYEPWQLNALAAAYAEAGNFIQAIECQKKAIKLYEEYENLEPEYLQKCQQRLRRYLASQSLEYDDEP